MSATTAPSAIESTSTLVIRRKAELLGVEEDVETIIASLPQNAVSYRFANQTIGSLATALQSLNIKVTERFSTELWQGVMRTFNSVTRPQPTRFPETIEAFAGSILRLQLMTYDEHSYRCKQESGHLATAEEVLDVILDLVIRRELERVRAPRTILQLAKMISWPLHPTWIRCRNSTCEHCSVAIGLVEGDPSIFIGKQPTQVKSVDIVAYLSQ